MTTFLKKRKKVLIGCSIAFGVATIFAVVGWSIAHRYSTPPVVPSQIAMPGALKKTGVLVGKGVLSKEIYIQDTRLGMISDIALGEFDSSPGPEIGIVGSGGALFLDENTEAKSSIIFNIRAGHVDIVDVDGDNICEYLNRGGGWQDVSLIDHKGNPIWTYGGMFGVDDICAGDIDRDGILEFVVGFNGGGGVRLLDRNAQEKWKEPDGNVWHVELADVNDDGSLEIVHSNAAGRITVRDRNGKIINQARPDPHFSLFSICRWPSKKDRQYALIAENDIIWLLDFLGEPVIQFRAPISSWLGSARGVLTRMQSDQPEYFAVAVEFLNWSKSLLYVYGADNMLVYQEIIPEACGAMASIPLESGGKETLLVGCNGKVWKYSIIN